MWNIVQNTLTALGINVFHTDVPFNAIWNTDQSVVSIVEGPEFLTSERTEQTSIETTDVVEFTTPNTPLSTFSFGDASATAATTTTTAAEAQTEEEPTATTATADRVGQKRVRQTENSEHTDGANDSSANTGQSENQSTARSLEKRNPKRMKTEETAPISSNQQGQQLAAQGTTGAPVVKEEHTENAYEHNSSVESPSASHKTHPTATDTSGAQLSVQRALNEQPSTSASPLLVRKRARENDNDEIEQPNTESPPEQSSPKRTKTNEVAASSLMHQQQPQTTASLASSSRHQEGQQQPLQQQNRSSVVPSLQHQEPQPRQQRQQQNQTYTRSSSRQQEQQQRQEQQAQAPARVPEGEGDLLCPYRGCNRSYTNAQERRFFSHLKKRHGAVIPRIQRNGEHIEKIYKNQFGTELNFQRYAGVPRTVLDEGDPIIVEAVPLPRARAGRRAGRGDNINITFTF